MERIYYTGFIRVITGDCKGNKHLSNKPSNLILIISHSGMEKLGHCLVMITDKNFKPSSIQSLSTQYGDYEGNLKTIRRPLSI